jgi:hypothetical protein
VKRIERRDRDVAGGVTVLVAALVLACGFGGRAHAQAGQGSPGSAVPKLAMPEVAKAAKDEAPKVPAVKIAGNFGQWTLVCKGVKD